MPDPTRTVTQLLVEVDVESTDSERRISQVIVEVDLTPPAPPAVRLLAAPAIDSAVMIV